MKQMKWYDRLQYGSMLLMAAAMPVGWRVGLWTAMMLALASLVKLFVERKAGNPSLDRGLCVVLWLPVAYVLLCALSLLYSSDVATGWQVVLRKAVLLIFPLCFLLTNTAYLTSRYLRGLGYALLTSLVGVMLFCIVRALVNVGDGMAFSTAFSETYFDARHHSYTALFILVALVFVYSELCRHWGELRGWLRGALLAILPLLALYVVIVNSRAGILVLLFLAVAALAHQAIAYRRWWQTGVLLVLLAGAFVGMVTFMPEQRGRFEYMVRNMQEGNEDVRVTIAGAAMQSVSGHLLLGNGVGDYRAELVRQYANAEFEEGTQEGFNAHNQYVETLLATGLVGLAVLLVWLLWPLVVALRRRHSARLYILMAGAVVMLSLLFESMLERQMGLLFIGYVLSVIPLILSKEENNFGGMQKS